MAHFNHAGGGGDSMQWSSSSSNDQLNKKNKDWPNKRPKTGPNNYSQRGYATIPRQRQGVSNRAGEQQRLSNPSARPGSSSSGIPRNFTGSDEIPLRMETRARLLAIKCEGEQIQEFQKLPLKEQLTLFLPELVHYVALPPLEIPDRWENTLEEASAAATELCSLDPDNDDDGVSSQDTDEREDRLCSGSANAKNPRLDFCDKLRFCPPMTIGFHATPVLCLDNHAWCYCPCGRHMGPWREFWGQQGFLEGTVKHGANKLCTFAGKKKPSEFLAHVRQLAGFKIENDKLKKDTTGCPVHVIIWEFLCKAFAKYHGPKMRHIGFYPLNSKGYQTTQKEIQKKLKKYIVQILEESNCTRLALARKEEERKVLEAEKTALDKQRETLERVNFELSCKVKANKDLKRILKAQDEEEVDSTRIEAMKDHCELTYAFIRDGFSLDQSSKVELEVAQPFDVSKQFDCWFKDFRKRDLFMKPDQSRFAFLFSSFSGRSEWSLKQVMSKWEIKFSARDLSAGCTTKCQQKSARALMDDHQAIDMGGPSREFLNQVWRQLGNLEVVVPQYNSQDDITIKLFEATGGGFKPQTDEVIMYKLKHKGENNDKILALEQIRCYYRAIGRILAHSLLLSPEHSGPVPILSQAFPPLYQSVLLRDITPVHNTYSLGSLVDHTNDLLDVDYNKAKEESPARMLLRKLGLEKLDREADEHQVRAKINELFVERRNLAISNLKDGLSLSGTVSWAVCFGLLPLKAIGKIAFARQNIREEDLFDAEGNWRLIRFTQQATEKKEFYRDAFKDTQEQFKQGLATLFRLKAENEPTFINTFVYMCTGQSYIPDPGLNPDWQITVEFNHDEVERDWIPVAHTCYPPTLKIPACAYEGNMETFLEKYSQFVDHSAGGFDFA